ncbi:MAG: hypothetical protein HC870_02370 [Rhizobiales bacterium]|nr:hypothetical protein [Hyphomicrobiales bacterium]
MLLQFGARLHLEGEAALRRRARLNIDIAEDLHDRFAKQSILFGTEILRCPVRKEGQMAFGIGGPEHPDAQLIDLAQHRDAIRPRRRNRRRIVGRTRLRYLVTYRSEKAQWHQRSLFTRPCTQGRARTICGAMPHHPNLSHLRENALKNRYSALERIIMRKMQGTHPEASRYCNTRRSWHNLAGRRRAEQF